MDSLCIDETNMDPNNQFIRKWYDFEKVLDKICANIIYRRENPPKENSIWYYLSYLKACLELLEDFEWPEDLNERSHPDGMLVRQLLT